MPGSPYDQPSFFDNMPVTLSVDKWQHTVNLIAKIFNAPGAWLMQANVKGMEAVVASTVKEHGFPAGFHIAADVAIYCKRVMQTKQHLYVRNAETEGGWDDNPEYTQAGFVSYLGVPVQWPNGMMFGTLCVLDTKETDYADSFVELMWQLKEIIEGDLHNLTLLEQLKYQSTTDELTGISNRRGFLTHTDYLISLAQRNNLSLSLIYFDLNNLKKVNDSCGHEAGDMLIKSFSSALLQSIRNEDVAARLGGDEFCYLGIHRDKAETAGLESRIQNRFELLTKDDIRIINPSFSSGSKLFSYTDDFDIKNMLSEVDALMYKDKALNKTDVELRNN